MSKQESKSSGAAYTLRPVATRLVWLLCALTLALLALALLMVLLGWSRSLSEEFYPQWEGRLVSIIGAVGPPILGALITARRPENPYGWLWLSFGLALALLLCAQAYAAYAVASPRTLPALGVILAIGGIGWLLAYASIPPFLMLLFPDGQLPSPRWRFVAWTVVAAAMVCVVVGPFLPGESGIASVENPLGATGVLGEALEIILVAGVLVIFGCALLSALSLFFRYRRADRVQRQQIKWFTYAAAVFGGMIVFSGVFGQDLPGVWDAVFETVILSGLYVAIGIAIFKHRLFDIDLIINRTLVYGTLTACVVAIYVLVVGYLGAVFRVEGNLLISLAATGLVAVLFAPLRDRLQRGVNRLMYGERDEPYAVISRLGERLEATLAPEAALSTIVETVAGALKLPYAAITLKQNGEFVRAAEYGAPPQEPVVLPLNYQSETVGQLILAPRSPGESFSPSDRRLLEDLSRQAGVTVHAVRLTADLQRSREQLVSAREEERRRLRRDLHDGLGPRLAAQTLKAGSARSLYPRDPAAADALLSELEADMEAAIAEVRRLVYDLRPPALDELGLTGALREAATRYEIRGLRISVEVPEQLPLLPAAVEVAAYRIAQEALTNVVRHAEATTCLVRLSPEDGALELEVSDDGVGLPEDRSAGVGLHSMRERAEELGGECRIVPSSTGGVRVLARLPLPEECAERA